MKLSIVSMSSVAYIVEAYQEIIDSLAADGVGVDHTGISLNLWYNTFNKPAYSAYQKTANLVQHLPRISNKTAPWWYTEDIVEEAKQSLQSINEFIDHIVAKKKPDVFFIADDTGILEASIINMLNKKGIPVVFIQHGHNIPINGIDSHLLSESHITEPKTSYSSSEDLLQIPGPSGLNGEYLICSYSQLAKTIMSSDGVHPNRIRNTGFPYFDLLLNKRNDHKDLKIKKKRILLLGSIFYLLNCKERAEKYYRFIVNICKMLGENYEFHIRLKPGENLSHLSDKDLLKQIDHLQLRYDSNDLPLYNSIKNYSLVIGLRSTVHIESIINDIPTILISIDEQNSAGRITFESILRERLNILTLYDLSELSEMVRFSLTNEYILKLKINMFNNESYLFHKLDGKAGMRIGQVILNEIV
jgi:hypothetical protein